MNMRSSKMVERVKIDSAARRSLIKFRCGIATVQLQQARLLVNINNGIFVTVITVQAEATDQFELVNRYQILGGARMLPLLSTQLDNDDTGAI